MINTFQNNWLNSTRLLQFTGRNLGIMGRWQLTLLYRQILAVSRWSKHYSSFLGNVQDCKCVWLCELVCVCVWALQYLHETAAFSFSTDKKACGDTGDLKEKKREWERDTRKKRNKESQRGQGEVNESFIKWMNAVGCCTATSGSLATNQQALIAPN